MDQQPTGAFGWTTENPWPTEAQLATIWPTTPLETTPLETKEIHGAWPAGTFPCPGCQGTHVERSASHLRCHRCRQDWDLTLAPPHILRAERQAELDAKRAEYETEEYKARQQTEYAEYERVCRVVPPGAGWHANWEMFYWKPRDCVACPRCKCQDTTRHLIDVKGIKGVPHVRCPRCKQDFDLTISPPRNLIREHNAAQTQIQAIYAQMGQFGD